ncbi:MAG: alpha-glucan family phosphorylase [Rhodocyclaceae bacterium]|nr:alpha-glucan family phosphorylase [Rhodocyclaceae bacterium]MCA3144319.1 alpha-glucan family phosphorylase [Rhodocyclaceae bacterium]
MSSGTTFLLEVNPRIPRRLARLEELASDLWYSWDRPTRHLFSRLHPSLWDAVGHSPKAFLKRVDEQRLLQAADDPLFLNTFNRVLSAFDSYRDEPLRRNGSEWLRQNDLVAYFCAEFGFHESMPIYSGGLGILAGDHCKSASDMRLPFVGVGLLYRQGYFLQTIDADGNQHATYTDSDFDDLPVAPVQGRDGGEVLVPVDLPGRRVLVKVWQARVGHVKLVLLDTDIEANAAPDRHITHRLYGGNRTDRLEQELVLGIGGVRALAALGLAPTVWHINEGHAAFLVLERMRELVASGVAFAAALEAVASNTVFTTHTPVPAGHDHFDEEVIRAHFKDFCGELGIDGRELLALGRMDAAGDFNMTTLAVRASRFQNGVSRIHGGVSSRILAGLWPQLEPGENPLQYVTNGVHVPTFLAQEWADQFDRYLGYEWSQQITNAAFWEQIDQIPDHVFWSVRQSLKGHLLHLVRHRVAQQHLRNNGSEAHLDRLLRFCDPSNPNTLVVGFARRFATYKRATLLFHDLDWLRRLICDEHRPVLFLFAGKAHPADVPGQDLIRRIHHIASMPEFEGRVLLLENYDLRLARRLVSGVDVWLNNPVYPLEASGTSGMKAGINGVLNLSVRDGWWDEGYDGHNGWAIKPVSESLDEGRRAAEEARTLYELLQDQVIPAWFTRNEMGFSHHWVRMAKRSIATLLPRYSATRMVNEYVGRFYLPATRQWRRYSEQGFAGARSVADWKAHVRACWHSVRLRRLDVAPKRIAFGEGLRLELAVFLDGLDPADVVVELVMARHTDVERHRQDSTHRFEPDGTRTAEGEHRLALSLTPEMCGKLEYRVRVYPHHELLTHPLEMGLIRWL